ncbi:MAG: diaminopimelate decarboxylase [bacterium]|nr:diaminopimelate decarboxylase [bacterium]MDT8395370.1 diaminopimelate decarboxylase [bacterium]
MNFFSYRGNELYCESVPVERIAAEVGTPFYLYSASTITRHFKVFTEAFAGTDHVVCYSVKACSNLAVLELLAKEGAGADIVSGGELFRALGAGIPADRIVFSGVGKRIDEIRYALDAGILMFNVESAEELHTLDMTARQMNRKAPLALRVNPDVDPKTHPYISTGMKKNKFGIPVTEALAIYREAAGMDGIEVVGVDCHIGSQLTTAEPFGEAVAKLMALVDKLESEGIPVRYVDVGGGLGIVYDEESPPLPANYAETIVSALGRKDKILILEPGRVIVGNAGILVARILYNKKGSTKNFVVVDAAMNDLIRPSLYDAYQEVVPVIRTDREEMVADVVGPICESTDFLARDHKLPIMSQGELLAIKSAGAYGFSMSSQYNSRPRVAEVMVSEDRFQVVRDRETMDDLVRGERIFKQ